MTNLIGRTTSKSRAICTYACGRSSSLGQGTFRFWPTDDGRLLRRDAARVLLWWRQWSVCTAPPCNRNWPDSIRGPPIYSTASSSTRLSAAATIDHPLSSRWRSSAGWSSIQVFSKVAHHGRGGRGERNAEVTDPAFESFAKGLITGTINCWNKPRGFVHQPPQEGARMQARPRTEARAKARTKVRAREMRGKHSTSGVPNEAPGVKNLRLSATPGLAAQSSSLEVATRKPEQLGPGQPNTKPISDLEYISGRYGNGLVVTPRTPEQHTTG